MFTAQTLKQVSRLLEVFSGRDRRFPEMVRSWDDFRMIPLSARQHIKMFTATGLADEAFNVTATSGSTSSRLVIAHSRAAYEAHLKRLVKMYRGIKIKGSKLCLNLCSYELNSGGRLMETAYKKAGFGVIPLGPISTPEKVREAVRLIAELKPTIVNAYTNQLFDLFSVLGREHSIQRCVVNGEPLWPQYRKRIETLGGIKVHDHYGAMEVSGFALAMRPDDPWMKVFSDGLVLEVLDDSGQTAATGVGDLVVTDLHNTCLPLIRYRLGDRVELRFRRKSLWIMVLQRADDSLLINGVVVIKHDLIRVVGDLLGHPGFFFILNKDPERFCDRLIINVVGGIKGHSRDLIAGIVAATGMDNCIDVRPFQGDIPRTSNGKIKYFIDSREIARKKT